MSSAEDKVDGWLTYSQVGELMGESVNRVRRLVEDRTLVALKRGKPKEYYVPELFMDGSAPLGSLRGTLITLGDSGFSDEEAVVWLFTDDPSLPGRPIDALRAGRKTEVRRRAQALAF
ncbi:Rv2175c family DNA-binding protein [Brevibacterium sp. 50QC2O2]|uniref:Rv2175c family DNA-binding protein n=1 Tax=Brevibacterium sp. 50QC2O2 TaxID=2968459 RepID=UPI0035944A32